MMRVRTATRRALATVSLTVATLAISATPSVAHFSYTPLSKPFGSAGAGPGQFSTPMGVAIDEGTEDVYVVDQGNDRVEKFEADGKYLSECTGSETPAKAFAGPTDIAVDNSEDAAKGHLYVADPSQNVVDAFDAAGKYLFQVEVGGLEAIATDTAGHVWVWTSSDGTVDEYSESLSLIASYVTGRGTKPGIAVDTHGSVYVLFGNGSIGRLSPPAYEQNNEASNGGGTALAANPVTSNIFEDEGSRIIEWPAFGEGPGTLGLWGRPEEEFGELQNSQGIAVDGKTGALYASEASANDVEPFGLIVTPSPVVVSENTADLTGKGGLLLAEINAENNATTYHFEYGPTEAYGYITTEKELGHTYGDGKIHYGEAEAEGNARELQPGTIYHYRVVATNLGGTTYGPDATFMSPPLTPPAVTTGGVSEVTQSSATLEGLVTTEGLVTSYGFEVSTNRAELGPPTGLGSVGAGFSEAPATLALHGLKASTTYFYRLVGTSANGTTLGAINEFTTAAFPSDQISVEQLPILTEPLVEWPAGGAFVNSNAPEVTVTKRHKKGKKTKKHRKSRDKKGKKK